MKKVFVVLLVSLAFFLTAQNVFAENKGFVGVNLGLDIFTNTSSDTDVSNGGYLVGGTGKYFFGGSENPKFGIGGTYNYSYHDDNDDEPGDYESDIYITTFDGMYNFSKNEDSVTYVSFSYGSATEDFSGTTENGFSVSSSTSSAVWGIGVGGFSTKKSNFSVGGDIRYLNAADSENADGVVQMYISLGYSF